MIIKNTRIYRISKDENVYSIVFFNKSRNKTKCTAAEQSRPRLYVIT